MNQERQQPRVLLGSSDIHCKPNAIGTSRVAHYLKINNIPITTNPQEADFIIVNTCGFTETYENITCDLFSEYFKEKKPGCKVIAIGCLNIINPVKLENNFSKLEMILDYSQLDRMLGAKIPYADVKDSYLDDSIFEFVKEKHAQPVFKDTAIFFINLIEKLLRNSKKPHIQAVHLTQITEEISYKNRSLVLIGRGCVSNCSYCIIKKATGNPRSRSIDEIIADIKKVYGSKRVVALVADDCASYGGDIGESFFSLVDRINSEFPGIVLAITYINPLFLEKHTDQYIDMFKKVKFDIVNVSLQSGSNRIIKLMNRHYDADNILEILKKLKEISPSTMFYSHFLAGFPGETWGDFYKTLNAARSFHYHNIFPFSPREGTKAATMDNPNSNLTCQIRVKIAYTLLALQILYRLLIPHQHK